MKVLADRYGVPAEALVRTNGFSSASQITPGTRLVIPVYSVNASRTAQAAPAPVAEPARPRVATREPAPAREVAPAPRHEPARHEAATTRKSPRHETLKLVKGPQPAQAAPAQVARRDAEETAAKKPVPVTAKAKLVEQTKLSRMQPPPEASVPAAKAKSAAPPAKQAVVREEVKPAASKTVAPKVAREEKAAAPKVAVREEKLAQPKLAREEKAAAPKVAREEKTAAPKVAAREEKPAVDPAPTASLPPPAATKSEKTADNGSPEFRWPARGRVIQGFKAGGNDGINIAVPEGTAVKAAEDGVVAYAGSELKGYGNLVLIRHPNGFVSAYANNGSLDVKRGDPVKRGQTIAKSGQSGNVSSPQLHFELRKGAQPVDPSTYLAGG